MAGQLGVLDAAKKVNHATNQRRGSFEAPTSFERDGINSPRPGRNHNRQTVHQEAPGQSDYRTAPPSFFKKVIAKAPSFRSMQKWETKTQDYDAEEESKCLSYLKELWEKVPIRQIKIIRFHRIPRASGTGSE